MYVVYTALEVFSTLSALADATGLSSKRKPSSVSITFTEFISSNTSRVYIPPADSGGGGSSGGGFHSGSSGASHGGGGHRF